MTPQTVAVETTAWVIPLQREMLVRLTYLVRWNPNVDKVEDFLVGQEVLGEVKSN